MPQTGAEYQLESRTGLFPLFWRPEHQSLFSEIKKEWINHYSKTPKGKDIHQFKRKYNTYMQKYSKTDMSD